jgi:hypothetical protein
MRHITRVILLALAAGLAITISAPATAQVQEVAPTPSITPRTHTEQVRVLRAEIATLKQERRAQAQVARLVAERDCLRAGRDNCSPAKGTK